ncbi:MAG: DUF885 domain-containing protein [Isosphaeraceae bacterium]
MHDRNAFLPLLLACLSVCVVATAHAQAQSPKSPSETLRGVFDDYWNDLLRRHPLEATVSVGDHRYDDRLNDTRPEAYDAWLAHLSEIDRRLKAVPASALSFEERVAQEVLSNAVSDRLALARYREHLMPLSQLLRSPTDVRADDLHLLFAQLGDFQPASTAGDVENYVRRLQGFPKLVDGLISTMKKGIAEKVMPPRVAIARVVPQLRGLAGTKPAESPLWGFTTRLPADWPKAERDAAVARVRQAIERDVAPAYLRLADFVEKEYLPACRETVGLNATPEGKAHYARLVRHYTTTDLTPDQVHEMGLQAVAKVRAAMDEIRREVGFDGELSAFLAKVRDDPARKAKSSGELVAGHRAILAEMEKNLPKLFGRLPTLPFEVQEFDPVRAKSSPAGEYLPMPADGSRPGIFFVNTLDPETRPTWTMQALAYHEAVPGHHFQGAVAAETPGRVPFRRFFYLPAYDEGWALYSEGLPAEIGLYRDPYSRLGRLVYDAQRCVRLVVDTGIHDRGWSRDQAIAYFEANTAIPRNEIGNEVDRYIIWPGQALAYKVGELTIRATRARLEARDGAKFDLRTFHDRLLAGGSVPLRLLETLVDPK